MKQSAGAKTLAMPTPVWLVGTYDAVGKPNIMTIAWGGICNSQPASVNVSLRKATYSYEAIVARKAFTVSIPSERHAAEADYVGTVSGRDVDKFKATGFTPVRSEIDDAPYVAEAPIVIECRTRPARGAGAADSAPAAPSILVTSFFRTACAAMAGLFPSASRSQISLATATRIIPSPIPVIETAPL